MGDNAPFLFLDQPCEAALEGVTRQIGALGMRVMRTFDLHVARHAHANCPCPLHGPGQCDCQMVVLLVYGDDVQPVSIVARGHNKQTWFSIVDTPQQRPDPYLEGSIRLALVPLNTR